MNADEIKCYLKELNDELAKMITLKETRQLIMAEPHYWCLHLMNFVDDFRYYEDMVAISEPFELGERKVDALLASTAESLCDELGFSPPPWIAEIPECEHPYFVGEFENLKAISIVESPLRFRHSQDFCAGEFFESGLTIG